MAESRLTNRPGVSASHWAVDFEMAADLASTLLAEALGFGRVHLQTLLAGLAGLAGLAADPASLLEVPANHVADAAACPDCCDFGSRSRAGAGNLVAENTAARTFRDATTTSGSMPSSASSTAA